MPSFVEVYTTELSAVPLRPHTRACIYAAVQARYLLRKGSSAGNVEPDDLGYLDPISGNQPKPQGAEPGTAPSLLPTGYSPYNAPYRYASIFETTPEPQRL